MSDEKIGMNFIERTISIFSPKVAFRRAQYRQAISLLDGERKYDSAGRGRRTSSWGNDATSANQEISKGGQLTTNRARDLVRNNQYARKAVQAVATNTVGGGIRATALGLNDAQEKSFMDVYNEWADTTACDFDGHYNLYGLQHLAMRCIVESGGVIVRKRIVKDRNLPVPLQLQVLEPDFIDRSRDSLIVPGKPHVMQGISFDATGKIDGYYMYDVHPGEGAIYQSNFIPISEIAYAFFRERPGQQHGVSMLASNIASLYDFAEYEEAQLIRQKIAACFTMFVSDPVSTGTPSESVSTTNKNKKPLEKVAPGIIEYLGPGKTVTMANPPGVDGYAEYGTAVLRKIAVGIGMSYEALSADYSNVNFSSARMGWLEFHRAIQDWQNLIMIPGFCNKIWTWFCEIMIVKGYHKSMVKAQWTPPRREMIDPVKETQALGLLIRNGLDSWTNVVTEMGHDPKKLLAAMVKDFQSFTNNKLVLECDPSKDADRMNITERVANQNAADANNTDKTTKKQ